MRGRILASISVLALVASAIWAPFAHVHPGDPGHHHDNGFSHAHLGHVSQQDAPAEGPELEDNDHEPQAVWTEWTPEGPSTIDMTTAEAAVSVVVEPTFVSVDAPPQFRVRSHDPPGARRVPARGPPA
jgi:hypothetical protein